MGFAITCRIARVDRLLWVMLGGALGSGARFLATGWVQRALGGAFPWGTLAVNVSGSFLLGVLIPVSLRAQVIGPVASVALSAGVLGGFTTYSSFSVETLALLQEGSTGAALANVALTFATCLVASLTTRSRAPGRLPG